MHVDDARRLRIALMDFPERAQRGSYMRHVTIGEVLGLIEKAFNVSANYHELEMYISKRGSGVQVIGKRATNHCLLGLSRRFAPIADRGKPHAKRGLAVINFP
jgi:hypothetical protein